MREGAPFCTLPVSQFEAPERKPAGELWIRTAWCREERFRLAVSITRAMIAPFR
jgi:hypothetical protein